MIIDLQVSDTRKIQLTIAINSISSKDIAEERVMHSKSKNIKFTSYNDDIKVIQKNQWKEVNLFLIQFNGCITNDIE